MSKVLYLLDYGFPDSSEDNKKRLTEISNWMSVLCGRHLERNHDTMLMAYQKRVVRRQAFYERIAWVKLQHLRVVVEKLSKLLVERQEELKIARTRQEVRLYRRLTVEACCLLYEVRLRSGELQKDGRLTQNEAIEECLKKGKMKHRPIGLMMFFAKELGKPLKWMRKRHMEVSFSKDLVFSGSETVSTPLSLMEPGEFLMRQREIQLGVLREMRRASNPLETKVNDITNRFKQKMLEKRMTLKETGKVDGFDDVSSAEEEEEPDLDHSATMEPVDPEAIKAILQSDYKGFFETVEAPAQVCVPEAAVADLPVASATAAVESVDASPPVDAEKALEDLFDLAKAQESLEQTCSSLLLQLSAVPGAQDAVAFFADLLEDLTTALRIGYIGASCLSDPANPRATPWKLRPHQLPWLPRHAALCAERCGVLRAVTAVLEGALPNLCPEPQVDEAGNEVGEASPTTSTKAAAEAATSTLASVANFLVSLPPIATAEMTEDKLKNVKQIQASQSAYAAILANGTMVSWGASCSLGDRAVYELQEVRQVHAGQNAFAALLADGSVVTWGNPAYGGDCSAVQDQLRDVKQIQAARLAFAAILAKGSVVTWGSAGHGGDSLFVQDRLQNVQQVQASHNAFAALLPDGSVVTWGATDSGGDSISVQNRLRNVQQIQANMHAFAAILADGSLVTWGHAEYGGNSDAVQGQLKNVQQVQASDLAFAAILADGSIVTWGHARYGGDSSSVREHLLPTQETSASQSALECSVPSGCNDPCVKRARPH
eukprot:s1045_g9.t1